MDRPLPFEDSFSNQDATVLITVGRPDADREEAVILQIDCTGSMSLDDGATDLVSEMLEKARVNLGQRPPAGAARQPYAALWVSAP